MLSGYILDILTNWPNSLGKVVNSFDYDYYD